MSSHESGTLPLRVTSPTPSTTTIDIPRSTPAKKALGKRAVGVGQDLVKVLKGGKLTVLGKEFLDIPTLFQSLDEFKAEQHADIMIAALKYTYITQQRSTDVVETVWDYVSVNLRKTVSESEFKDFQEEFKDVGIVVQEHKKKRNKKSAAFMRIASHWMSLRGNKLVEYLDSDQSHKGDATLGNWAKLSEKLEIQKAILLVNHQILERNDSTYKIGQSRTKGLVPADVKAAVAAMAKNDELGELDGTLIAKHGLMIGETGLLVVDNGKSVGLLEYEDEAAVNPVHDNAIRAFLRRSQEDLEGYGAEAMVVETPRGTPEPVMTSKSNAEIVAQMKKATNAVAISAGVMPEDREAMRLAREVEENELGAWNGLGYGIEEDTGRQQPEWLDQSTRSKRKRIEEVGKNKADDNPYGLRRDKCECRQSDYWKSLVETGGVFPRPFSQKLKLLDGLFGLAAIEVCDWHLVKLGKYLGLAVDGLKREVLVERLKKLRGVGEGGMAEFRLSTEGFPWFRPNLVADYERARHTLGVYKFKPIPVLPETCLKKIVGGKVDLKKQWSVELRSRGYRGHDTFGWIFTKALKSIAAEELALYQHHHRRIEREGVVMHHMVFSLIQQVVRQSPLHWLNAVHARLDGETQLISYPSPAWVVSAENEKAVIYTELDSGDYFKDSERCKSRMRDLVVVASATDMTISFMPGMSNSVEQWLPAAKKGNVRYFDLSKTVSGKAFESVATRLGSSWKEKEAVAGKTYFVNQGLPTRLPEHDGKDGCFAAFSASYVAVFDEEGMLEDGSNVGDVMRSHKELMPLTHGRYTGVDALHCVPHRVPFAVEVCDLGAVSDALIGRRSWSSITVMEERDRLLSLDENGFALFCKQWQTMAVKKVKEAWVLVQKYERLHYGDKSYFKLKEDATRSNTEIPDLPADDEVFRGLSAELGTSGARKADQQGDLSERNRNEEEFERILQFQAQLDAEIAAERRDATGTGLVAGSANEGEGSPQVDSSALGSPPSSPTLPPAKKLRSASGRFARK
jgi:hypothetical protein